MRKGFKILIIFILCLSLAACLGRLESVEGDQVEKIAIWRHSHQNEVFLEPGEAQSVLSMYGAAHYGGKATGEGGTPEFGLVFYLKNGERLYLNDFSEQPEFEAFLRSENGEKSDAFYVESDELRTFTKNLLWKYGGAFGY